MAVATAPSEGSTEDAHDVTLAEARSRQPAIAERVRATNRPDVRLVEETDEQGDDRDLRSNSQIARRDRCDTRTQPS